MLCLNICFQEEVFETELGLVAQILLLLFNIEDLVEKLPKLHNKYKQLVV